MDQRSMFVARVEMEPAATIAGEDHGEVLLADELFLEAASVAKEGTKVPVKLALKASVTILLVATMVVLAMIHTKPWGQPYGDFSMSTNPADVVKYFDAVRRRPLPLEGAAANMLVANGAEMQLSRHISDRDRNLAVLPTDEVIKELTADVNENKKHLQHMARLLGQGNLHVLSEQRQANIASCVFDALLASDKIANAGVAINAAVHTCPNPNKTNACVANVGMSIASFAASASFLAQMAFVCPEKPEPYSMCVSPIMNLIQGFGQITLAAGGLQQSCGHDFAHDGIGATVYSPVSVTQGSKVAVCVILVNQAVFFLGRAGLQIDAAVKACDAKMIKKKGALCSAQVTSVIMAFTGAAATLSGSAAKCAKEANFGAACSANINNIIGGLASIANFASAMANENCAAHPR
eukprot:TRINITY_DN94207_c0_g1_i1.p1 TRINITY_DN94207_c0_g1~~TRINITY_DN94207_c0_g1_i1.p1  ORF type:complete len:427 (+),score=95.73 TRINITY_DN94207_c0_g1_i1:55-1281(+)